MNLLALGVAYFVHIVDHFENEARAGAHFLHVASKLEGDAAINYVGKVTAESFQGDGEVVSKEKRE